MKRIRVVSALLPLVLPPVVAGVGLLAAFGRRGVLVRGLAAIGIRLPFTTAGAILASAFVATPLLILTGEFTALGVTRMLESLRIVNPKIRFYQASSSEMFGMVREILCS